MMSVDTSMMSPLAIIVMRLYYLVRLLNEFLLMLIQLGLSLPESFKFDNK